MIVSFTGKLCTLSTPPRNGALVCISKGAICVIMCRKGTDLVFDASMLHVCANAPAKWHYWSMLPYKSVTPGPNCAGKCSCFTLPAAVSLLHYRYAKFLGEQIRCIMGDVQVALLAIFFSCAQ